MDLLRMVIQIIFVFLCAVLTMYSEEVPKLRFDERTWKVGFTATQGDASITEYVLEEETVEQWSELITTQTFYGVQDRLSAKQFTERMRLLLIEKCPGALWQIIQSSEDEVLYEWEVIACAKAQDQYEIARVIIGKEALHVLHYAIKKTNVPKKDRELWMEKLKAARLQSE